MKSNHRILIVWCRCGQRMAKPNEKWRCPGRGGWVFWHYPRRYYDSRDMYIPFPGIIPSIRRFVRRPIGLALLDLLLLAVTVAPVFPLAWLSAAHRPVLAEYLVWAGPAAGSYFLLKWYSYSRQDKEGRRPKIALPQAP